MADQLQFNTIRAVDANGEPVSSARAYFYEAGTTTLVTVFEEDGVTPHPSPLLANAAGIFPSAFYGLSGSVKVAITDASDVMLPGYPIEAVPRSNSTTTGARNITFAPVDGNPGTNVQKAIENNAEKIAEIGVSSDLGKSIAGSVDPEAVRALLELGTSATLARGTIAEIQAGTADRLVDAVALLALLTPAYKNLSTTGGVDMPSPLSVQLRWGAISSTTDGNETFSFDQPFTTSCVSVSVTRNDTGPSYPLDATSYTAAGFTVNRDDSVDGNVPATYFAIGY